MTEVGSNAVAAELAELKAEVAYLRTAIEAIVTSQPMKMAGITMASRVATVRNEVAPKQPKKQMTGNRDLLPPLVFGPNGVKR